MCRLSLLCCVLLLGADISDYFNYGFDEESWKFYCKKQSQQRAVNRKKARTKITVRQDITDIVNYYFEDLIGTLKT